MAYLLEKRRSGLLALRRKGVGPWPSSFLHQSRAVEVIMAYLLKKRRSCLLSYLLKKRRSALPIPKKTRRMTMASCLSSSLDSLQYKDPPLTCRMRRRREKLGQGGHGLGHHLLDGHLIPLLSRELWRWSGHIF